MIAHREPCDAHTGKIDCPECGEGQSAAVVIRDEAARPVVVCCLECRKLFSTATANWRRP
jgi:uncharacterized Zn finger protein